jgi:hypothetical protein
VDWSEVPTLIWEITYDDDGDGAVSEPERERFLEEFEPESRQRVLLTLDERILDLEFVDSAIQHGAGDVGLNVLRVSYAWEATVPPDVAGPVQVKFIDVALEGEPGWRTLVVKPSEGTIHDASP